MITMSERKKLDSIKKEFVKNNMKLYELAYNEFTTRTNNRNKHKRWPTNYSKFIELARVEFGYSFKTSSCDIWNKFIFTDIILGIHDRKKLANLNHPITRRILGYIDPKKTNLQSLSVLEKQL